MYGFRRGSGGAGGAGNVSTLSGGANGRITLWNGATTVTGDPSGTWSGTGHTFVVGSPTFNASDGHFTGPAGASFGPSAVGGGFTNQPAGDTVTLVSDNAADNTQQVTIIGVLAGVDASENITLTDVTPVVSVGTYDLVLALVLNAACVGTVTASETSGGLAITTIAPAALSAGLQTFAAIDGYGKVLQIVASGATTKTVGIGGYALGGAIQREPVVLTGTTKVNTTNTWEGAVQFYLGDLEATRTVTLNSIAGFDFSPGLISIGTQQDTFISRASAGLLLVEDGSGNARDVQARTVLAGDGSSSAPGLARATQVNTGIWFAGSSMYMATNGTSRFSIVGANTFADQNGAFGLGNVEAASYQWKIESPSAGVVSFGGSDAASPVAQTLQSQGSRGGTDTNTAGGNLTIRPGAGTGSATGSSIVFQTPTAGASGTGAQTQTTRLSMSATATAVTAGAFDLTASGLITITQNTGNPVYLTNNGFYTYPSGAITLGIATLGFGALYLDYTNTATVGAVTINKPSGRVILATGATSVVVTNSLATAASHVFVTRRTNDTTALFSYLTSTAGSFTIFATAAATADTEFDFFIVGAD